MSGATPRRSRGRHRKTVGIGRTAQTTKQTYQLKRKKVKHMNKIQLIDAETLYYKPLAHPRMLIDGILADGLAVMAGDSKIGKSWMVLWLCLQISKGEPVWGSTAITRLANNSPITNTNCCNNFIILLYIKKLR